MKDVDIPTMYQLLDPVEEQEIGDSPFVFEGGDKEITEKVKYDLAVERGEIIEVEDDSEEEEDAEEIMSIKEVKRLCEIIEQECVRYALPEVGLELAGHLRRFWGHLQRVEDENARQTTLDGWVGKRSK
ncbi:hypothetical protein M422DRAFT_246227 [Sphaerobolus stellatus SS14]|nr:hypothetical protein M422DRAFT_246227 [Sphaerobolus stellatus SS14]